MADTTRQPSTAAEHAMTGPTRSWLAYLGPGLVLAAASVGAGDMVTLLLTYAAAGSMVLPILATALLLRLNRADVDTRLRNGIASNVIMALAVLMFATLAGVQIVGFFA